MIHCTSTCSAQSLVYLNCRNVPENTPINGPCYFLPSESATCKGRYFRGNAFFSVYFPESKTVYFLDNSFKSNAGTNVALFEKNLSP